MPFSVLLPPPAVRRRAAIGAVCAALLLTGAGAANAADPTSAADPTVAVDGCTAAPAAPVFLAGSDARQAYDARIAVHCDPGPATRNLEVQQLVFDRDRDVDHPSPEQTSADLVGRYRLNVVVSAHGGTITVSSQHALALDPDHHHSLFQALRFRSVDGSAGEWSSWQGGRAASVPRPTVQQETDGAARTVPWSTPAVSDAGCTLSPALPLFTDAPSGSRQSFDGSMILVCEPDLVGKVITVEQVFFVKELRVPRNYPEPIPDRMIGKHTIAATMPLSSGPGPMTVTLHSVDAMAVPGVNSAVYQAVRFKVEGVADAGWSAWQGGRSVVVPR